MEDLEFEFSSFRNNNMFCFFSLTILFPKNDRERKKERVGGKIVLLIDCLGSEWLYIIYWWLGFQILEYFLLINSLWHPINPNETFMQQNWNLNRKLTKRKPTRKWATDMNKKLVSVYSQLTNMLIHKWTTVCWELQSQGPMVGHRRQWPPYQVWVGKEGVQTASLRKRWMGPEG